MKIKPTPLGTLLLVGLLGLFKPGAAWAQQHECYYPGDVTTLTCSGGDKSACTKTVAPGTPSCIASCPGLECFCVITNSMVPVTEYSGTVTETPSVVIACAYTPTQDCPNGSCTFVSTTGNPPQPFDCLWACLNCTIAGTGTPDEQSGTVCTSEELFGLQKRHAPGQHLYLASLSRNGR